MIRKKLLNYTTEVPATKTATEIIEILSKHGVKSSHIEFDDRGNACTLSFLIRTAGGLELPFRLPINSAGVLEVMRRQKVENHYLNEYQAARTAWRIAKVWVEAQVAIIDTGMVAPEEVFLPYLIAGNDKTLYENIAETKFQLKEAKNAGPVQ